MAQTRPHQRVIAMIMAISFFAFSFGLSFLVIWQLYKDNKEAKKVNQSQTATNDSASNDASKASTTKLAGTKLDGFTPVDKIDTLQTIDQHVGNGSVVKAGDTVTVHYTGAVAATGVVFQSSYDSGNPVTFPLGNVIQGWQQGIPGMKSGGKRRLLIPAALAYGATPPAGSNIPANADLVFDVTLISIGQ